MPRRDSSGDLIPLGEATRAWFRVSLQTFGGPAGQISVMHRELVDDRRWIGERRFLHALNCCTLLPGPEAQQLAIYLGWLLNGTAGGLIAGTLFVLPGFVAIMALSVIYAGWGDGLAVNALFAGVAPAVLAIVAQAVVRVSRRALRNRVHVVMAVAAFAAPGPLIQIVQFVGFMGAYRNSGTLNPWVSVVLDATLVTWVTYVPCFLFIFLGAPKSSRSSTASGSAPP